MSTATYFDTKNDKTPSRKDLYLSRHSPLLTVNFFDTCLQKKLQEINGENDNKFGLNNMLKKYYSQ